MSTFLYRLDKLGDVSLETGMLWWYGSNSKITAEVALEIAVKEAMAYYKAKYGGGRTYPNRCFANPSAISTEVFIGSAKVSPLHNILPQHLWIGMEKTNEAETA